MDEQRVRKIAKDEASDVGCGLAMVAIILFALLFVFADFVMDQTEALDARIKVLEAKVK